jgi:hypothetical protein
LLSRFSFCGLALRGCGSIDGCAYSVDVINTLAVSARRFASFRVVSRTQNPYFRRSSRFLQRVRFRAAPPEGPQFSVFRAATSDDVALMGAGLETARKSLAAPRQTGRRRRMFAYAGGYPGGGLKPGAESPAYAERETGGVLREFGWPPARRRAVIRRRRSGGFSRTFWRDVELPA